MKDAWIECEFEFPDDNGATEATLLNNLPDAVGAMLVEDRRNYRLRGVTETDATVLMMAVSGLLPTPVGDKIEFEVPLLRKAAIDAALPMLGQSQALLTETVVVSGHPDAMEVYLMLWKMDVMSKL
jgi:hypothetical protein